jgi:hypothetical protein
MARGLDEFSSQQLANMAGAFARQARLADTASKRLYLGYEGVQSTSICMDIGEELLQKFFGAIAETNLLVRNELHQATPQHICNLAWAFATLRLKHTRFLEAAKMALAERVALYIRGEKNLMTSFTGQNIANLLWALAALNVSLGDTLEAIMAYITAIELTHEHRHRSEIFARFEDSDGNVTWRSVSRHFNRQELASMAWACAVCGNYPKRTHDLSIRRTAGPQRDALDPVYKQSTRKIG